MKIPKFSPHTPLHSEVTASKLNQFGAAAHQSQLMPGVGTRLTQTSGGTSVSVIKRRLPAAMATPLPLTIVGTRPAYIPAPEDAPAENTARFYLTWGLVNGFLAENWSDCLDVPTSAECVRAIWLKAYLSPTAECLVTRCEWITLEDNTPPENPPWSGSGDRPDYVHVSLGSVFVSAEGAVSVANQMGGSLQICEFVSSIESGEWGGTHKKSLAVSRV